MPKRKVTSAPWVPVPARAYTGKAPRARQHRAVGRLSAGAPRLHKIFTLHCNRLVYRPCSPIFRFSLPFISSKENAEPRALSCLSVLGPRCVGCRLASPLKRLPYSTIAARTAAAAPPPPNSLHVLHAFSPSPLRLTPPVPPLTAAEHPDLPHLVANRTDARVPSVPPRRVPYRARHIPTTSGHGAGVGSDARRWLQDQGRPRRCMPGAVAARDPGRCPTREVDANDKEAYP